MAGLNGYIQLELGGEKRGFKFTLYPYGEALSDQKIIIGVNSEKMASPAFLYSLAYRSLNYNLSMKGDDEVSKTDVFSWIDEAGNDFLGPFEAFIVETMQKNVKIEEANSNGIKTAKKKPKP